MILKEIRLLNADVDSNKNKFWNATLFDNGEIRVEYGRVGYDGCKETYSPSRGGERFLNKKIKEKTRKGYKEIEIVSSNSNISTNKQLLKNITRSDKTELQNLLDLLIEQNIHNITLSTNITFDKQDNLFKTPLGIVSKNSIFSARQILNELTAKDIDPRSNAVKTHINDYLRLIPQSFGMGRFNVDLFKSPEFINKQISILDSLEVSHQKITTVDTTSEKDIKLNFEVDLLDDQTEFNRINKKFEDSKKKQHTQSNHLKIDKIYKIQIKQMFEAFSTCGIGNTMELWHGSSVSNILSIFNSGLKISPPSTVKIAGKMFGSGIYGASDSTKSLNYSVGYWTGQRNSKVFLFVADFAMGKHYTPTSCSESFPKKGYDSTWAKAKHSGVYNDEFIVYKENQVNLKYLIECK